MLEATGGLLAFVSVIAFFVAIFCLFKPIRRIGIGSRKRALLLLLASFVITIVAGSMLPKPTPEEIAAAEAQRAQEKKVRDEKAAADTREREGREAAEVARLKPAMTAAATTMWRQMNGAVAACDTASKRVADAAGARNVSPYTLYPLVTYAKGVCLDASTAVRKVAVPDEIPTRYRSGFEEARETCENAYIAKFAAFDSMAKVLDGNMRPSAVSAAQADGERAQAGVMLCGIGYLKAANDAGLDLSDVLEEG